MDSGQHIIGVVYIHWEILCPCIYHHVVGWVKGFHSHCKGSAVLEQTRPVGEFLLRNIVRILVGDHTGNIHDVWVVGIPDHSLGIRDAGDAREGGPLDWLERISRNRHAEPKLGKSAGFLRRICKAKVPVGVRRSDHGDFLLPENSNRTTSVARGSGFGSPKDLELEKVDGILVRGRKKAVGFLRDSIVSDPRVIDKVRPGYH